MPFYVWWSIPLIATLLAVIWLSWRSRERTIDPHDSMAERQRFVQALRAPLPGDVRDQAAAESSARPSTDPPVVGLDERPGERPGERPARPESRPADRPAPGRPTGGGSRAQGDA